MLINREITPPRERTKDARIRSGGQRVVCMLLTLAMLIGMFSAVGVIESSAATTETFTDENNISWTVTESYPGWAIKPTNNNSLSGKITIPDSYNNKVVIAIDSSAFSNNRNITEVEIPDSVLSIGSNAFQNCLNLRKVKNIK